MKNAPITFYGRGLVQQWASYGWWLWWWTEGQCLSIHIPNYYLPTWGSYKSRVSYPIYNTPFVANANLSTCTLPNRLSMHFYDQTSARLCTQSRVCSCVYLCACYLWVDMCKDRYFYTLLQVHYKMTQVLENRGVTHLCRNNKHNWLWSGTHTNFRLSYFFYYIFILVPL